MEYEKGQVIGHYTVQFRIARQGGGTLYRVRQQEGGLCFLKVLDSPSSAEAALRKAVSHPNICQWQEEGVTANGEVYFVTAFASTEAVADRLRRSRTLPAADVTLMMNTLLRLLRELHAKGIAHRNISAETVLLDLTGTMADLRLTDFSHAVTQQPLSQADIDSDLTAVARLAYQALFGMEASQPLRIPNLQGEAADEHLLRVFTKALASEAEDRFGDAASFLNALRGAADVELP